MRSFYLAAVFSFSQSLMAAPVEMPVDTRAINACLSAEMDYKTSFLKNLPIEHLNEQFNFIQLINAPKGTSMIIQFGGYPAILDGKSVSCSYDKLRFAVVAIAQIRGHDSSGAVLDEAAYKAFNENYDEHFNDMVTRGYLIDSWERVKKENGKYRVVEGDLKIPSRPPQKKPDPK